ncbi:MAG TPA: YihY/virulence factor BrkB family protein [bacterium]|nr:YihY/virulence factor BrkB family protein [bacterium]
MTLDAAYLRWLERVEARAWQMSPDVGGLPASIWRCLLIVLRGIVTDRVFERAGYLTYFSLLYAVPLLALMLALAEALGWGRSALEFVAEKLAVTAPELAESLVETVARLDFVAIGLVAFAAIVVAGFAALIKFEAIVDDIWVAREHRPLWRTLALYPLLIVAAPTVAALVLAIAAAGRTQASALMVSLPQATLFGELLYNRLYELSFLMRLAPVALIVGLLTLVYYMVPSGRVRWQAALLGGVAAGLLWHLAQGFYLNFQFATGTFRAVWGLLAQIPLLLLWVFVCWVILIVGVELSFAWQHRHTYLPKAPIDRLAPYVWEHAVLEIARLLVETQGVRPEGLSSAEISNRLRIPWSLVRRHLSSLLALGAVHAVRVRSESSYFAAGDLGRWTIGDLLDRWRRHGDLLADMKGHAHHWPDSITIAETIPAASRESS